MKRNKEHIVGDVGETRTSLVFKEWGWTADKIISDYGEDLDCQVFINNLKTQYHFRCQIKSTEKNQNFIRLLKNGDFSVSIDSEQAKSWLLAYYPVFLIVFDKSLGNHFWVNSNSYIKSNLKKISQKSITFRIPASNILTDSKDSLLTEIKNFYANIFHLDEPILSTNIYPIIMPNYLSTNIGHFISLPESDYFTIEPNTVNIEKLPSWFLNIEALNPPNIFSLNLTSTENNLEIFLRNIKTFVADWDIKIKDNEWLSFIISPIQMKSRKESISENEIWNKNITSWFCFCKIGGNIFYEKQYSFQPPDNFYSQVARKAMSYETFHHINPSDDIAIELFSSIKAPLSYKYEMDIMSKQISSQFIPWKIKEDEERMLFDQLPQNLSFSKVNDVEPLPGFIRGIISHHAFNPTVGLFSGITDWDELNKNSIRNIIKDLYTNNKIVGVEDEESTSQLIQSYFDNIDKDIEHISISEKNEINGYPIDLSNRMIFVQRYRIIKEPDIDAIDCKLGEAIDALKANDNLLDLHCGYQEVDEYSGIPIYRIFFHWKPSLIDSSSVSFAKSKELILKVFDEIFPREKRSKKIKNTYDILRFCGQLYFEEIKT